MTKSQKDPVSGFSGPSMLPDSDQRAKEWQHANQSWWQKNPMRYDWKESISHEEFTAEFYQEIDRRFFSNAEEYLVPTRFDKPFAEFIDFEKLPVFDVLEIGIGNGSHAQLLASRAKSFIGIDLTEYAVRSTTARFSIFKLPGQILQMDAEHLDFPDKSFDFVWSWGVIHHSSNTKKILEEIYRVLRPGGSMVVMVYHRGWWNYHVLGFLRALVKGDLFRGVSLAESMQAHTDGALARYYTFGEWRKLTRSLFSLVTIETRGPKSDIVPLPNSSLKRFVMRRMSAQSSLFLTRSLRMGTYLVCRMEKI